MCSEKRKGTFVESSEKCSLLDPQFLSWMLTKKTAREDLLLGLLEFKVIIEAKASAAALATERAASKQVLNVFSYYEAKVDCESKPDPRVKKDTLHHSLILEACGNPLLQSLNEGISMLLRITFRLPIQIKNSFIRNLVDNLIIAKAIKDKIAEKARNASIVLLQKNKNDVVKIKVKGV